MEKRMTDRREWNRDEDDERRLPENQWRRDFHRRFEDVYDEINSIKERLSEGKTKMEGIDYKMDIFKRDLATNQSTTDSIKEDTAALVGAFKGVNVKKMARAFNAVDGADEFSSWLGRRALVWGPITAVIGMGFYYAVTWLKGMGGIK